MPPVVAVVAAIATAVVAATVTSVVVSAIVIALIQIAATIAITLLTKKPKANRLNQGQELATKIFPDQPRTVIVGRQATGGSCHFAHTRTNDPDKPNRFLYRVIQISDQPCQALVSIREGKNTLTFSGDVTTGWRTCNQHRTKDGDAAMWCRVHLGSMSPTADATLVSETAGLWTNNHKGRGLCYAIVKYDYDADAFPGGEPELVFEVDGARVYDDRFDDTKTGGSGTQRLDNYSTWVYNETTSVVIAQYLRGFYINGVRILGVGAEEADLYTPMLFSAHNTCEQLVSTNQGGGGTEKRYVTGMLLHADEPAEDHLVDLMAAMDGEIFDRGGAITIWPGAVRTPAMNISEQDIDWTAEKSWQPKPTLDNMYNFVHANFIDRDRHYQERDLPVRKNAQWEIDDGGERFSQFFSFRAITKWSQGQRITKRLHAASRFGNIISFVGPLWLIELEQGDWFTMTNSRWGFVSKYFQVQEITLTKDMRVAIVAREVSTSLDDWGPAEDEFDRTDTEWTPLDYTLPQPTFSLAPYTTLSLPAGVQDFGIIVTLLSPLGMVGSYTIAVEVEYALVADLNDSHSAGYISLDQESLIISGLEPDTAYAVRARCTDGERNGEWSSWVELDSDAPDETISDSTHWIEGPTSVDVIYDSTGANIQQELDLDYVRRSTSGIVTSGIAMTYKVLSGTVNGFDSADGEQSMTVSSGHGTLHIGSLETGEAIVRITATKDGGTPITRQVLLTKELSAPGEGGGGAGTQPNPQTSDFDMILTPWTSFDLVAGVISYTIPAGKTTARVAIFLYPKWTPKSSGLASPGPWNIEAKVQRDIGGTWTDEGSVLNSNPDPYISSGPDGTFTVPGTLAGNVDVSSLTAGNTYDFRVVARISSGDTTGNTSGISWIGNVTISSPS